LGTIHIDGDNYSDLNFDAPTTVAKVEAIIKLHHHNVKQLLVTANINGKFCNFYASDKLDIFEGMSINRYQFYCRTGVILLFCCEKFCSLNVNLQLFYYVNSRYFNFAISNISSFNFLIDYRN
jgi:predicted signal transduction protein with EAL and GGDEF domain